jgi:hypothetical protein
MLTAGKRFFGQNQAEVRREAMTNVPFVLDCTKYPFMVELMRNFTPGEGFLHER